MNNIFAYLDNSITVTYDDTDNNIQYVFVLTIEGCMVNCFEVYEGNVFAHLDTYTTGSNYFEKFNNDLFHVKKALMESALGHLEYLRDQEED